MTVNSILSEYLSRVAGLESVPLGPGRNSKAGSEIQEKTQHLLERLERTRKFNDKLAIGLIAMFVALFLTGVWLVIQFLNNPAMLRTLLGGNLLSLGGVIYGLRLVWREKTFIDLLLTIIPEVEPAEALKVIQAIYFKTLLLKQRVPA